jgi:hypothetical protein
MPAPRRQYPRGGFLTQRLQKTLRIRFTRLKNRTIRHAITSNGWKIRYNVSLLEGTHMSKTTRKEENPLISIMLNVVIPVIILIYLSKEKYLGPTWGLIAALILPIGYGLHTLIKERRADFISIIGIVSVLLTGVIGILKLPPVWLAVKEAAIPLVIGMVIVISLKTPYPLIKKILMSEKIFNVKLLHEKLREKGNEAKFNKRLVGLTWGLASSFFLSSALNYFLARFIVKTDPLIDLEAYTAEIGKMTGWSYVVVMLPSMAVMILVLISLIKTLTHLTDLKMDDLLAEHLQEEAKNVETSESQKVEGREPELP